MVVELKLKSGQIDRQAYAPDHRDALTEHFDRLVADGDIVSWSEIAA